MELQYKRINKWLYMTGLEVGYTLKFTKMKGGYENGR